MFDYYKFIMSRLKSLLKINLYSFRNVVLLIVRIFLLFGSLCQELIDLLQFGVDCTSGHNLILYSQSSLAVGYVYTRHNETPANIQ